MGSLSYEVLVYLGGERTPEVDLVLERHRIDRIFRDEDIFKPGEPFSWSRLMDHGFRQAKGTWVMYASDDIVIHPMAFPLALGEAGRDESVGGITFLHRNTVEDYGGIFKDYGFDRIGERAFINFGIIRKKAYQQIEGFDTRFLFYWADVDVCLQIWKAGYRIIPAPFSLVEHINIVDAYRVANSGDRYFADTEAYFNKWSEDTLFKGTACVAKQRHVLDPSDAAVVCSAAHGQEGSANARSSPLVSAIVSTYNSARFLRGCLDDLLAQEVEGGLEIIVVNSGSEQNEAEIVHEYQEMHTSIVYIETEARESVYAAWNRAIEVAQGTFITNANTDDRHAPGALGTMSALLKDHPQADVVYADSAVTRDENSTLANAAITGRFRWPAFDRTRLFQICTIGLSPCGVVLCTTALVCSMHLMNRLEITSSGCEFPDTPAFSIFPTSWGSTSNMTTASSIRTLPFRCRRRSARVKRIGIYPTAPAPNRQGCFLNAMQGMRNPKGSRSSRWSSHTKSTRETESGTGERCGANIPSSRSAGRQRRR